MAVPDSAVRLLLGTDVIQSPLMVLLLDKLLIFWGEEDDYMFHQGQMVYIPRLLLSQFRFLDRIVDGKELTRKLLTVLTSTSLEVQKEILACVPDIVEDSEHGEVAKKLREELTSNKDLACAAIDALTYLNISEEQVVQVRTAVMEMLKTFSFNDLPIVVNFLLESLTPQDALEVVNEIRSNIDFVASSRLSAQEKEKINTSAKLTVDALKGRMQFQRHVAEAWIKALDSAQNAQMLDVYVLLALHWLNHRKAVESLVRNKIRKGLLTEHNLSKAFSVHTQIVRDYFPSILSLAQTLVRSAESHVCLAGSSLYRLAFTHFDAYCKQEIIASLMTHIGSGLATEIDASLNILTELVNSQLKEMTRFAVFIKGALDYLDHNNLSILHIRKLYLLLARLAFCGSDEGNYLQDELLIIIRKQLTSGNSKYKRMGVMGAIAIIQALAGNSGKQSGEQMRKEKYKQTIDLLELMRSSCRRDAEMTALFLDNLAATLASQRLAKNVETWISDNMTETFEETFVSDQEDLSALQGKSTVNIECLFGLNNEAESTIFINLVPLVEKILDTTQSASFDAQHSPLCLAPLFRLITRCEMLQPSGDLENIDALLGCPILMIKPDVYNNLSNMSSKEKDIICASLFFCINWAREVINSFASMTNDEMKKKVILRLRLITQLNGQLAQCLAKHPNYVPFPAIFELDKPPVVAKAVSKQGGDKKKGGTKGDKGKKKKKGATIDETLVSSTQDGEEADTVLTQSSLNMDSSVVKKPNSGDNATSTVDLGNFRQCFRELDISVFTILKVGLTPKFQNMSKLDANTSATDLHLDVAELKFLLEDMALKLKHALVSTTITVRRGGFFKGDDSRSIGFSNLDHHSAGEIAKQAASLFPTLCDLLEDACNFFQAQASNEEDDPEEENMVRSEADTAMMGSCFNLLLQCVQSLLCWEGFKTEEHHDLYMAVLMVAVRKLRPDVEDGDTAAGFVSQQEGLRCTFQYFSNLVETAPDLDTAVILIKLLRVLSDSCSDESVQEKLAQIAKSILNREWRDSSGELQKGAHHNENLQLIIRTYVVSSKSPLEALEGLAIENLASMVNLDKRGHAEGLASLNRWTFPAYYKVMLTELIANIKRIPAGKKSDSLDVLEERLLLWTVAVKILYTAVSLTKVFNARANLSSVLKLGRQFVELFLRQGMPLMDITFRRRHAQVEKLLRSLQQSTRMLHHLCGHSKINKDVALTNQVPMLKRALETFVYRVKAMLALNNCQDAFWMGNLKNRNLQGEEILTQTSIASSGNTTAGADEEDDDDEETDNPAANDGGEENEESEVEMEEQQDQAEPARNQEDSSTAGGSYSEIF
ncbi:fanconi anemia group d2 protein [Plakobranchus ocellatus]|uniref:Fanconi anemia group d2 protein n=1 Tax=Plakobranchus ocellatus TaxID=259542 RepID=A0AAV4BPE9_9GAST|nr:fanconi anemia group d2 protein [Plakobranchus ocellatus]